MKYYYIKIDFAYATKIVKNRKIYFFHMDFGNIINANNIIGMIDNILYNINEYAILSILMQGRILFTMAKTSENW